MAPESHKSKTLDQEVQELVSSLTGRLRMINNPHKPGDQSTMAASQVDNDDNQGVRIITLAGSNVGATMRGEKDEKQHSGENHQGMALPEQEDFMTCVNSNFQAINNSIMLGGSYESNDPGVHLDIADYVDNRQGFPKHEKKGKKHVKGGGHKSDRQGGSKSDGERD